MTYATRIATPIIIGFVLAACGGAKERPADSSAIPPNQQVARAGLTPDPDKVIELAKTYHFGATMQQPVAATAKIDTSGRNKAVPRNQDPRLEFAPADTVSGVTYPKDQEVLLLIQSHQAYPGLGIQQGRNYLWRDKSDPDTAKWVVWLISDHPRDKVRLRRDTLPYSSVDPKHVHLVRQDLQTLQTTTDGRKVMADMIVFGACIDDPICSTGHCGYTQ